VQWPAISVVAFTPAQVFPHPIVRLRPFARFASISSASSGFRSLRQVSPSVSERRIARASRNASASLQAPGPLLLTMLMSAPEAIPIGDTLGPLVSEGKPAKPSQPLPWLYCAGPERVEI